MSSVSIEGFQLRVRPPPSVPSVKPDPDSVTELGTAFSGRVTATTRTDGYSIDLFWPWGDMQMGEDPQRGWFLGLEVEVIDEDSGGQARYSLSDGTRQPELWSELRLFATE